MRKLLIYVLPNKMMSHTLIITSIVGLILSIYALYVGLRAKENKNYKAACDISDKASCTKAFSSSYGKMFGVSNSIVGAGFYLLVIFLAYYTQYKLIFYLSALSLLITIYLAYVLYIKMKNLCIVCTAIYLINILLFIFAYAGR